MNRAGMQRSGPSYEGPTALSTFGQSAMRMGFHTNPSSLSRSESEEAPQAVNGIELHQEIARLRQELEYYKALVDTVLLPLLPQLEDFADRLLSATSNFDKDIDIDMS